MKFLFVITLILLSISLRAKGQHQKLKDGSENFDATSKHDNEIARQSKDLKDSTINTETKFKNLTILQRWQKFESNLKVGANAAIKMLLPYVMKSTENLNISTKCMKDVMQLIMGLRRLKPWAVKFIDSSAKVIDGMFEGTLSSLGIYDECVDTKAIIKTSRDVGKVLFTGQYCTVQFKLPASPKTRFYRMDSITPELKNFSQGGTILSEAVQYSQMMHFLSFRMGICVPSGCSLDDIDQVARKLGDMAALDARAFRCELREEIKFSPLQIATLCAIAFAGLLTLIGTIIGIYTYYTKKNIHSTSIRILLCFDVITNFKKFTNTKTDSNTLTCLNGIRFLSITWIVLGHTYFVIRFEVVQTLRKAQDFAEDFAFQAILNGSVAVDTFLCIGGLLVCYLTIKRVKIEKQPFNKILFIVHRLWRIMPVYIYIILFMFLTSNMGSGPIWFETTSTYIEYCRKNWWTNLLFINNFYDAEHMCFPHSWYIACDFQLYVASLLLLIPLIRWPKVGISLTVLAILASIIYTAVATVVLDFPVAMLFTNPDPDQRSEFWASMYFRPFIHVGAYCIGMLAGYILATKPDLKIPPVFQVVGWCLAFITNFSVLYGVFEWNKGKEPPLVEGLLYASLNRSAWSLGIAWMIVCCATGHGGVVNYILSWKVFIPLGRLTFIVYLIHLVVQMCATGYSRTMLQPDHLMAVYHFFGHLCISYMAAFGISMLLESPTVALEKIVFKKAKKTTPGDFSIVSSNGISNGKVKSEKNGDIAMIVSKNTDEISGVDNDAVVYKI